jgi:hypothetical protein
MNLYRLCKHTLVQSQTDYVVLTVLSPQEEVGILPGLAAHRDSFTRDPMAYAPTHIGRKIIGRKDTSTLILACSKQVGPYSIENNPHMPHTTK